MIEVRAAFQGEGTKGVLLRYLKPAGGSVSAGEPVAEIETDKVTVEVAAPAGGILVRWLKTEGAEVAPGDVLGYLDDKTVGDAAARGPSALQGEAPPVAAPQPVARDNARNLSPAVRRLAAEHQIDLALVSGSGRNGRITVSDVLQRVQPSARTASLQTGQQRTVPHSPARRRTAHHMVQSLLRTAPHVTSVFEVDLGAVLKHQAEHRPVFETQGVKLTMTAYLARVSKA